MSSYNFIFLPGTLCDERVFHHQTHLFNPNIVIDLRSPSSVEEMVESIFMVPADRMVLIGFSMGGHVAQEFALKHPERVEKLIVIASSSEGYPEKEKQLVLSYLPTVKSGLFRGITNKRLQEYLHPNAFLDRELRKLIQSMAGPDAREVYLRQIQATLERKSLMEEMKTLAVPALFIGGENDAIVPIQAVKRSAQNAAKAKFISISKCGHFPPLEKPEEVNQSIQDFLNSQ